MTWHLVLFSFSLLSFLSHTGTAAVLKEAGQNLLPSPASISHLDPIFYSNVELRHQLMGYVEHMPQHSKHEEPSAQARAQFGAVLYRGFIDAYLNLSVEKPVKGLAVYQRRPELNASVYVLRSKHVKIRQYNTWRLPFSSKYRSSQEYESQWEEELDRDGTVYIIGLSPRFMADFFSAIANLEFYSEWDLSSRLYSRPQYAKYVDQRTGTIHHTEDYVPRLGSIQSLGANMSPVSMPKLEIGGAIYYRTHFLPRYFQLNDLGVQNRYSADRASYYKFRLQLQLNKRISLINDFIHFHKGFFEKKRVGSEKRYKNIFRLSCVL